MASGDLIVKVADKDTLDRTYANTNAILAAVGEDVRIKGVKRYGMKINKNDSNPATRCTYLFDAVGMTPAAMNYSAGRFDFGDWGNVFFVKNNYPAMVKYDGTEDYKLDPNDHTKKADGKTASDVSNTAYGGNAMSVFDGSGDKGKIWDRINGLLMVGGEILAKMTPPYNLTGKDFEKVGITFASSGNGYQKGTKSSRFGRIVNSIGGSSST